MGCLAALAACGGNYAPRNDAPRGADTEGESWKRGSVVDLLTGGGGQVGNLRYGSGGGEALAGNVNRHLWRATLDTLSFLPIASTDPYSGVIATDWASVADDPNRRVKVSAYITSRELDARALRVAVFQEQRGREGWTATPAAPDTVRRLEDAILVRARQMRIEEKEG